MSAPLKLILATRNPHKLEEIRAILADMPVTLRSAAEAGAPEVVEDQPTLEGNASKKAGSVLLHALADGTDMALADDTGLFVDALGGRPGVHSARYAGEGATYADNVTKLLDELRGVPPAGRKARFECVIALSREDMFEGATVDFTVTGTLEGEIALERRGANGFGYDPVFLVAGDAQGRTLAELSEDEKNRISHRARALEKFRAQFTKRFAGYL